MTEAKRYEKTFSPKAFEKSEDGKEVAYSGTVTMVIPDWEAQLGFAEIMGEVNAGGALPEDEEEAKKEAIRRTKDYLKRLVKTIPAYFVAAKIVRRQDAFELTSWEDITHESPLAAMLVPELGFWLSAKHLVSDPSKPS